jgi:prepilin-type N-terminal cleavage/methylation domain-containing protein
VIPLHTKIREKGFSLIELLVALGIFLLITGAAFSLLSSSQQRYQTDSQLLNSFQEARLGLDQMVRDIDDAGYPSQTFYVNSHSELYTFSPFAWSPSYPGAACTVDITCITPGNFDVIIETNPNPQDAGSTVRWIRYQLAGPNGTTLFRGDAPKTPGDDPATDTAANFVPFVQNVVNNSPSLQIGISQLSTAYPNLFPSGNSVPIFTYYCDTPTSGLTPPYLCSAALSDNSPTNIRDVAITLVVASPLPDATTGQPRLVQLTARGHRLNPNH